MDRIFRGAIRDDKIRLEMREQFSSLIASLNGQQIELTLRKARSKRSTPQNSYYWGIVIKFMAEHCGYDPEEMHDALKQKFLRTHGDTELPTVRSTAKLNTAEFTEYLEQCRRLAAEMSIYVPDPNEVAIEP